MTNMLVYKPAVVFPNDSETAEELSWRECLAASAVRTFHKQRQNIRSERKQIDERLEVIMQYVLRDPSSPEKP